jgi:hypothetical protein
VTRLIILQANRDVEAHNLGFCDAQIWATARLNQISEVYSEDFNTGAIIEGVQFTERMGLKPRRSTAAFLVDFTEKVPYNRNKSFNILEVESSF